MQVQISRQHMDNGKYFTQYMNKTVNQHLLKYFQRIPSSDIKCKQISRNYHNKLHNKAFSILINVQENLKNINFTAEASDKNPYNAFAKALNKVEKQLRRFKNKIKSHKNIKKYQDE